MYPINITEYLDLSVKKFPERIAAEQDGRQLAFGQLHNLALRLAKMISDALAGEKRKVVAVYLPKCLEAIVADLAILYSGNIYMNLDVHNPESRLDAIIRKSQPVLLLGSAHHKIAGLPALEVDLENLLLLDENELQNVLKLRSGLIDTDLLCLINTSGSTGVPKAVALSHRGFIDFTETVRFHGLVKDDEIIGSLSPLIFDIWSFELCMLMAFGSRIICLPERDAAFPVRLLEKMRDTAVSFIFWVPTIMVNIANMKLLAQVSLPDLKMIWFAGEVFPTSKFNYWRKNLPGATFANFYGPIEITLDCLYYVADRELDDDDPIPIGKPFRNTAILVLDETGRNIEPDSPGMEGELCVLGSSLAMGYYNSLELTAAAFTQNPLNNAYPEPLYHTGDIVAWNEDGDLVFRGRKDTLIKHLGYRIEMGEIENAALNYAAGVTNACAMYDAGAKKIVLVYEAPEILDEKGIRSGMARTLPKYMLPVVFIHVFQMPRNANGKIDRNYLKQQYLPL